MLKANFTAGPGIWAHFLSSSYHPDRGTLQPKQERLWELPCAIQEARLLFPEREQTSRTKFKFGGPTYNFQAKREAGRRSVCSREALWQGYQLQSSRTPIWIQRWYIRISYFWTNPVLDR